MKELSIEDKAKRYDEAIEFAHNKHRFSSNLSEIKLIEELFPELKEDEREIPISEQKSAEEYNITGIGSKNAQGKLGEMIKRKLEIEKQGEQILDNSAKTCKDEQMTAWSEEDEKLFRCAIDAVKQESKVRTDGCLDEEVGEMVTNWLKSLKERIQPQNTWKPSDEQMDALHYVTNFDYGGYKAILVSLYEQLKKLRKE